MYNKYVFSPWIYQFWFFVSFFVLSQILDKCLKSIKHTLTHDDVKHIADAAHGYVGADLAAVCKEGWYHPRLKLILDALFH